MRHVDWREWMAVPWFWLGAIPLTFGVRLAIDLGKEGGDG